MTVSKQREPVADRECWKHFVERMLDLDKEGHLVDALMDVAQSSWLILRKYLKVMAPKGKLWRFRGHSRTNQFHWSHAMLKQLLFATTLFSLITVPFADSSAEEMTLQKALKAWSFLDGEWTILRDNAPAEMATITKAKSGVSWVFDNDKMHGQFGFDGAEKKMFAIGIHEGGGISIGHWMPTGEGIIEGTFTFTTAEGDVSKHTGKFVIKGDSEFSYTLDGNVVRTFKKK